MAFSQQPDGPDHDLATEVDEVANHLLSIWDQARERAATRLSASQLRTLLLVEQHPGVNLGRLANGLGMILSSASRLCDRLVAAGMLDRVPGRSDRREIALHLTAAGQAFVSELRAERRRRLAEVLTRMSPAGRVALLRGLYEFRDATTAQTAAADEWSEPAAS